MTNESGSTTQTTMVRKRDGLAEVFSKSKISACLRNVLEERDEDAAGTANELARAVAQYLTTSKPNGLLRSADIAALLPRVLDQTGHNEAAAALKEYSRLREHLRRNVRVLAFKPSVGRIVPRRWNKSVLVSRLRQENGLEQEVARFIGGRIEQIVLNLGMPLITGALVRELAVSKLHAWGLAETALVVRPQKQRRSRD